MRIYEYADPQFADRHKIRILASHFEADILNLLLKEKSEAAVDILLSDADERNDVFGGRASDVDDEIGVLPRDHGAADLPAPESALVNEEAGRQAGVIGKGRKSGEPAQQIRFVHAPAGPEDVLKDRTGRRHSNLLPAGMAAGVKELAPERFRHLIHAGAGIALNFLSRGLGVTGPERQGCAENHKFGPVLEYAFAIAESGFGRRPLRHEVAYGVIDAHALGHVLHLAPKAASIPAD